MARWTPREFRVKEALNVFHDALESDDPIWEKHCQIVDSTSNEETHVFPGFMPHPREFLDGRHFVGLRDFTFGVVNRTYELSAIVDREYWEDDQYGLINARVQEMAEVWTDFKEWQFAQLLINGATSGFTGWDGTIFYADTRVIGDSANIDNNLTSVAAADNSTPTAAEILAQMSVIEALMRAYQNDRGLPFNRRAANDIRVVVPPKHKYPMLEAINATTIAGDTGGPRENVQKGTFQADVSDYLTGETMYINLLGSPRKPFIMQKRIPLEIIAYSDEKSVAEADGVKFLSRERYFMTYGEPRRSAQHVWTT